MDVALHSAKHTVYLFFLDIIPKVLCPLYTMLNVQSRYDKCTNMFLLGIVCLETKRDCNYCNYCSRNHYEVLKNVSQEKSE